MRAVIYDMLTEPSDGVDRFEQVMKASEEERKMKRRGMLKAARHGGPASSRRGLPPRKAHAASSCYAAGDQSDVMMRVLGPSLENVGPES